MHVGLLQIHVYLPASKSLKDKRQVLKSVKQRIRNNYNVSVAETGGLDSRQYFDLAMVMVANDRDRIQEVFRKAVDIVIARDNIEILDETLEFL